MDDKLVEVNAPVLHEAFGLTKAVEDYGYSEQELLTTKTQLLGLPVKPYLEQTVIPLLLEGIKIIVRERPTNPTEYLGLFLLKNSRK
ncbi:hypothetical protein BC829DRAFT_402029 [Chytridium lagenaria]|nr:hypothetical protein BC829DRAFT_402029 [Chytridium lagenaria]